MRRKVRASLCVLLLLLGACQDSSEAPARGSNTAAIPEDATAEPMTTEQAGTLDAHAHESRMCTEKWLMEANLDTPIGTLLHEAGLGEELRDVAQRLAPAEIERLRALSGNPGEGTIAFIHFKALDAVQTRGTPMEQVVIARAWQAYFANKMTKGSCPLHPELLRLIGKQ